MSVLTVIEMSVSTALDMSVLTVIEMSVLKVIEMSVSTALDMSVLTAIEMSVLKDGLKALLVSVLRIVTPSKSPGESRRRRRNGSTSEKNRKELTKKSPDGIGLNFAVILLTSWSFSRPKLLSQALSSLEASEPGLLGLLRIVDMESPADVPRCLSHHSSVVRAAALAVGKAEGGIASRVQALDWVKSAHRKRLPRGASGGNSGETNAQILRRSSGRIGADKTAPGSMKTRQGLKRKGGGGGKGVGSLGEEKALMRLSHREAAKESEVKASSSISSS
ncbi:hypothetical protein AAMO2058_000128400 [Amorphochlora amoebiformis]